MNALTATSFGQAEEEMDQLFVGAVRSDSRCNDGVGYFTKQQSVEEDSWTEVERQELDHHAVKWVLC